ncbi:MAG: ClbS/DfsB family four-helix bundle protein [Clostridium sp.]|uniref:ClbS/DfsB family four-helix bundle protein n=1 Tax=Clostridium sp. TaxID=1506 RepID=UPI002900A6A0|nr:ClbS/DfsB family four-helix bundle protein [Clostridium sp.]MDU1230491.1 ClbS/DfsB family four-helix bundle protein [Clostridium sp.]MDU3090045.1 ClbS/DfsB family four-helix bundle protein [Clostridium sp.]
MVAYKNREELILEISKRAKLFINEFDDISEKDKDKFIDEVDRTPAQMIAYQLGWMNLIIDWENKEKEGQNVITPAPNYKWNNLGGLYEDFYNQYEVYSLEELCISFVKTEEKIIELINTYTDTELFEQGGRNWSSSMPSNWAIWKWIHINTVAPFKSFRTKIRKWKKIQQA